jgi:hypothetical protein
VEIRRELARTRPDAFLPGLASSLNNFSLRLAGLGRREEGLEAITEAVEICRELARERPAVHQDALEQSREVLSHLQEQVAGQPSEGA